MKTYVYLIRNYILLAFEIEIGWNIVARQPSFNYG